MLVCVEGLIYNKEVAIFRQNNTEKKKIEIASKN